jgi:hypothetical protein
MLLAVGRVHCEEPDVDNDYLVWPSFGVHACPTVFRHGSNCAYNLTPYTVSSKAHLAPVCMMFVELMALNSQESFARRKLKLN